MCLVIAAAACHILSRERTRIKFTEWLLSKRVRAMGNFY